MRQHFACISLVVAILAAGCGGGGGGVEADMKKSGDELRKEAAAMSVAELEKKMDEIEKYAKELEAKPDDYEPSQADVEMASKLMEVTGIFGAELMKRKMK
jgi:hypothetical protein